MASVSMAIPSAAVAAAASKKRQQPQNSDSFFGPLCAKGSNNQVEVASSKAKLRVEASLKEKAVASITAAAFAASMVVPEVAQAVEGVTPSLKNFLLSIVAGGVVLLVLVGAVIAVANFDPVKRS